MKKLSAGLLLFRRTSGRIEVMLVHPGGPFFAKKDEGAWSIPKGLCGPDEDPLVAARRELQEETCIVARGELIPLGELRQPSGKVVIAWAVEQDADIACVKSNTFELEWPPRSGKIQKFPEVDRAGWFSLDEARLKIMKGQTEFLDRLLLLQAPGLHDRG